MNAVKHIGAGEISIASTIINDDWKITIQDNGKGFEFENAFIKKDSYGLKNMKERAAASGLNLEIASNDNEGTVVLLQIVKDA